MSVQREVFFALRERFPLCEVQLVEDPSRGCFSLRVRDAGGLTARADVDVNLGNTYDLWPEVASALRSLADAFETPSSWMAL